MVAVLDTGITDHPDLRNKLVPGYNFISDPVLAMNGVGRSADPTDPGDYIDANVRNDLAFISACGVEELAYDTESSWHGTQVAGLIAAQSNNAYGMAGAGGDLRILPVRVLGKCGGFDSDILTGMLWSAGIPVPGIPENPNPARVINLSLGSSTQCTKSYATVIANLSGKTVVVAAAGNNGGPLASPANCPGVLAVAGLRNQGDKVGFSSFGKQVGISAPAGNCINTGANQPCLFPMYTTTNSGLKGPVGPAMSDEFNYTVGTSFCSTARVCCSRTHGRFEPRIDDGRNRGQDQSGRQTLCAGARSAGLREHQRLEPLQLHFGHLRIWHAGCTCRLATGLPASLGFARSRLVVESERERKCLLS